MLSRRVAVAAFTASVRPIRSRTRSPFSKLPAMLQIVCSYADLVVKVPQMAESISEGTLKQFSKGIGERVERDEEIASIETDKIDISVNAPEAGTIKELLVSEDATVTVGQDLAIIEVGGSSSADVKKDSAPSADVKKDSAPSADVKKDSAPSADVKKDSAPKDATKDDVIQSGLEPGQERPHDRTPEPRKQQLSEPEQQERPQLQPRDAIQPESTATSSPPSTSGNRGERRIKMNRMRLRIAERLKQSQNTAASLTTFNEVDMSNIMDLRKLYKDDVLKKTGVKLGFMGAFSRAAILAMQDIPTVNASIEGPNGGDTIVYRDYVDVSVAVATKKGLVTPVVRNVESMSMIDIERAIADLGKKARDGKLAIEDMAGGTFTISNGGVFGSLMGTPIINLSQSAVLGLHAIKDRPIAVQGKVEIRPMMYLALTYDHRLLDGRDAVQFLVKIKEYIEDPRRMLIAS
ncbi:Dihydrolipoamide succinyltransferase [Ophiocordyceps sinensis CO18]|uniref:dihydrolipoyllysine-residue succinyltransferase n=1 Tax=Ophiocordyceps sinensis (strain Co18 / CGMCC 3.14243) TaxID=911162 RepID=T5ALS1_OPHSC|nr:Dihydrolipoamide succinyltransferase [Ophiocordyceps sinensis CO18]